MVEKLKLAREVEAMDEATELAYLEAIVKKRIARLEKRPYY